MRLSFHPFGVAAAIAAAAVTVTALTVKQWQAAYEVTAEEPPIPATPSPTERAHGDLHARYAEARLRLAQANLAKAENLARTVTGQVSDLELASLRRRVKVLEQHVGVTRELPHGNGFLLARVAAETAVHQAEEELAAARSANTRQPKAISAQSMRQLEAALDLARARLAIWDDRSFLDSPQQVMQMQIDQLADELCELIQRVDNRVPGDRR